MDLLYVTEDVPKRDPVHGDGSSMISYEVVRHLPPEVRITLVAFGDETSVPPEVKRRCAAVHVLPLRDFRLAAARSVVFGGSLGALRRDSRKAESMVSQLSEPADVTMLHGPHVAFLSHSVVGPVVLQVVDPWSARALLAKETSTGAGRLYRSRQARRTLEFERSLPPRARLLTVGREDAKTWSGRLGREVRHIANGVDRPAAISVRPPERPPTICFVGSLNYEPNVESVQVLVQELAPKIWAEIPATQIIVAGRSPTPAVLALASDRVDVRANVPSMLEVLQEADVAVFPDRHGLGVRNSVSEALAAGLHVVATSTAAREQPSHPRLLVTDDDNTLVEMVCRALSAPGQVQQEEAGELALRSWDTMADEYHAELRAAVRTEHSL